MKKIFNVIILFLLILFCSDKVLAQISYDGYYLNKYDINIVVNENNTLKITENIGAYFEIDKHGIFRKLPLKNKVVRLDGTTSYNRAKITDISVNDNYSEYNENGYKVIKIGSPNYTMKGQKDYTISYLYNLGKDTGKDYDELYFNLIGDEWDTSIGNITFTITMPKEFDETKLGFSSGAYGSTDSSKITYSVDGNVIKGKFNGILNPKEAFTVRLELPEGYFVGASSNVDIMMILALILPIIFLMITLALWYKYGKDEQVIDTVEFYPPEGFNSAEVGFLYKGEADNNDVVSLLIYLANKGYLKIHDEAIDFQQEKLNLRPGTLEKAHEKIVELEKQIELEKIKDANSPKIKILQNSLETYKNIYRPINYQLSDSEIKKITKKNKGFVIEKVKDYDGNDINEKIFLDGLFSYGYKTQVVKEDLYNSFYITISRILATINKKENKHKIFEKNSLKKGAPIIAMIIATFILISVKPLLENGGNILYGILFPGIGFSFLFASVFGKIKGPLYVNGKPTNSPWAIKLFGIVWGLGFGGIPWFLMVHPALSADSAYMFIYIIGLVCILFMILLYQVMPKRNAYGREMLGKIKGFKNFLETAEKHRLESMVTKEPTYFYDILPYAYVLGVSDKWIEKFESIAFYAPDWYEGSSVYNAKTFRSFIDSTMTTAYSSMNSQPSSSSSGGSSGGSGGGSSGGGSGGGGGGSW